MAHCTGTYNLSVQTQNSAPVLAHIGNQTLPYPATTLAIPLHATDADGDSLTIRLQVMTIDRLAEKAYALDQQLGLHTYANGGYRTNAHGVGEKYLLGKQQRGVFHQAERHALPVGRQHRQQHAHRYVESGILCQPRACFMQPTRLRSCRSAAPASMRTIVGDTLIVTRAGGLHRHSARSSHRERRPTIQQPSLHDCRFAGPDSLQPRSAAWIAHVCQRGLPPKCPRSRREVHARQQQRAVFHPAGRLRFTAGAGASPRARWWPG